MENSQNEQKDFTAYTLPDGEVYIENANGENRRVLSSSGSSEHERAAYWLLNVADNDDLAREFAKAKPE
jgi:hypothetical protein